MSSVSQFLDAELVWHPTRLPETEEVDDTDPSSLRTSTLPSIAEQAEVAVDADTTERGDDGNSVRGDVPRAPNVESPTPDDAETGSLSSAQPTLEYYTAVEYKLKGDAAHNVGRFVHSLYYCPVEHNISPYPMKTLPRCLHRVCSNCLRSLVTTNYRASNGTGPAYITCPVCRQSSTIPSAALEPGSTVLNCPIAQVHADYILFPCLNEGCGVVSVGQTAWRVHTEMCPREVVQCTNAGCTWMGPRAMYERRHQPTCGRDRCPAAPYCSWVPNQDVLHGSTDALVAVVQEHCRVCPVLQTIRMLHDLRLITIQGRDLPVRLVHHLTGGGRGGNVENEQPRI